MIKRVLPYHIEATKLMDNHGNHVPNVIFLGDICRNSERTSSSSLYLRYQFLQLVCPRSKVIHGNFKVIVSQS